MSNSRYLGAYFPSSFQKIIIQGFSIFKNEIDEIYRKYNYHNCSAQHKSYVIQLIYLIIIQKLFGLNFGEINSLLEQNKIRHINNFLKNINHKLPSQRWMNPRANEIINEKIYQLDILIVKFLDYFWVKVGENSRSQLKSHIKTSKRQVTPEIESFMGLYSPSELLPSLSVDLRAKLIPYFNSGVYRFINRITSQKELLSHLKQTESINGEYQFRLAGRLGFVIGPPSVNYLANNLKLVEQNLKIVDSNILYELTEKQIIDLGVVSIDGTKIVVSKKDKTASAGKCSTGDYYGHNASIAADSNCIPISTVVDTGSKTDITLAPQTLEHVFKLANSSNQEIYAITADAGYSSYNFINFIKEKSIVPIVDINPRNSKNLQYLKQSAINLEDISKKAIRKGLKKDERKQWLIDIKKKVNKDLDFKERAKFIHKILLKYENKALRKGLSRGERRKERILRRQVMKARYNIRRFGSEADKSIALTPIPQGTISWYLIYHIRSQNEGINSIKKKRGNLKGDGQWHSWKIGKNRINHTIQANNFYLRYQSTCFFNITGKRQHTMRTIYNWRLYIYFYYNFDFFLVE